MVAGTATAVSGRVQRRQQARWAQQDYEQAQPAAPAQPADDPITKLKELGELRDSGVLTEEEFAAQKAKLLG
jgi:hypothetical protein